MTDYYLMKRILAILTAGIMALLSFNSCEMAVSEFDIKSCEAYLTCYYAGGKPPAIQQRSYEIEGRLRDKDIEDIFYDLSSNVAPGFMSARLEVDFFDWMDNYDYTRAYEFWWETTDLISGDGYYAWEEIID